MHMQSCHCLKLEPPFSEGCSSKTEEDLAQFVDSLEHDGFDSPAIFSTAVKVALDYADAAKPADAGPIAFMAPGYIAPRRPTGLLCICDGFHTIDVAS